MKQLRLLAGFTFLLVLLFSVGCGLDAIGSQRGNGPSNSWDEIPTVAIDHSSEPNSGKPELPALPAFPAGDASSGGHQVSGGDPFAGATFSLVTGLPAGPETAVVERHYFGRLDEHRARALADQFGFTGPLYVQRLATDAAQRETSDHPVIYTAFEGQRVLTIGNTGLTYEDRTVVIDYNNLPAFDQAAPLIKAQLQAWDVLNFPYIMQELPVSGQAIYRLIDGIATNRNEFNIILNQDGEFGYFDYQPLRQVESLGNYPLRSAELAWQQLLSAARRDGARYLMFGMPAEPTGETPPAFLHPRAWEPVPEAGEEHHLYLTPTVYEALDGSELRITHGRWMLEGDSADLTEIAAHLKDVLHVWGTVGEKDGAPTISLTSWEVIDVIHYESVEGTIVIENDQTLLRSAEGELFRLPSAGSDIPDGLEVFVSVAGRRDTGAAYPILDWLTVSEKVSLPDTAHETADNEEGKAIDAVTIDSVQLAYFAILEAPREEYGDSGWMFLPVWQFSGTANQRDLITFWLSAVDETYRTDE